MVSIVRRSEVLPMYIPFLFSASGFSHKMYSYEVDCYTKIAE